MHEVLTRRFTHGMEEKEQNRMKNISEEYGSFTRFPDLILMDGGKGQVNIALQVLDELRLNIPVCGMVKDDHHRTCLLYTSIAIIEVGGTVGDIESQPFLEAIRQFQHEVGHENAILIHVTLIPYLSASGELKTKPTQASVKELQGMGIQPDVIVCRTEHELDRGIRDKIALFCNVPRDHVLQNLDVEYLYEAPLAMEKEHLAQVACESRCV